MANLNIHFGTFSREAIDFDFVKGGTLVIFFNSGHEQESIEFSPEKTENLVQIIMSAMKRK